MKKLLTIVLLHFLLGFTAKAQESPVKNGFGFGFQLNQYQRDFGFGVNISSPYFLHDYAAVRMRSNIMYLEHVKDGETTWTP